MLILSIFFITIGTACAADSNTTVTNKNTEISSVTNKNINNNVSTDSLSNTGKTSSTKVSSTKVSKTQTTKFSGANDKPTKLTQSQILTASKTVNTYVTKNNKFPNYVTIGGYKFSMAEYTYMISKTIYNKYNKKTTAITIKYDIKNPSKPSGTTIKGTLTKYQYYVYSKNMINYINKYNKIPNSLTTKLGKMQYQTALYGFNRVLYWSKNNKNALPSTLTLNIAKTSSMNKNLPKYTRTESSSSSETISPSSPETPKISQARIWAAATSVRNFIETNGQLPNYITISGYKYSMNEFLYLLSKTINTRLSGSTGAIGIKYGIKNPTNPSGVSISKCFTKAQYNDIAKRFVNYITKNNKVPNYLSAKYGVGNIPYQTALYGLTRVGDYINKNKAIPTTLTFTMSISHTLNQYVPVLTNETDGKPEKEKEESESNSSSSSSDPALSAYLLATTNCQVNNAAIQSLAKQITFGLTSELSKATAIFNYVRDNIAYSFYYNTKKGASGTLSAKSGNCVDQSHLVIALCRASGIAARYVNGYCKFSSGSWYGHVWAEIYVNGKWVVADTTSTRNYLGTINNWNTGSNSVYGKYSSISF